MTFIMTFNKNQTQMCLHKVFNTIAIGGWLAKRIDKDFSKLFTSKHQE